MLSQFSGERPRAREPSCYAFVVICRLFQNFNFSKNSFRNTIRVSDLGLDWLQSLKQFFINVSYNILVASLTLMALF